MEISKGAPRNLQELASNLTGRPAAGRLQLIVGRSCPWAHRAWLVWRLRQLEPSVQLLIVEPDPKAGRWVFPEPRFGCNSLAELYQLCGAKSNARATVPLLLNPGDGFAKSFNN
ncbi:hypothetical protein AAF134_06265 [Synechococcus lacustris Tous-12m]